MDEFPLHFYNACLCSPKSFSVHSQEGHPVFLVAWFSCSVPFSLSCYGLVCHRTVTAKCYRLCLSHVACSSIPLRFRGEDTTGSLLYLGSEASVWLLFVSALSVPELSALPFISKLVQEILCWVLLMSLPFLVLASTD